MVGCVRVGVVVGLIEISGGERGGECSGREDEGGDGEKGHEVGCIKVKSERRMGREGGRVCGGEGVLGERVCGEEGGWGEGV